MSHAAQYGRDGTRQLIGGKNQFDDAASLIYGNPIPQVQGCITQPIRLTLPSRTVSRLIEGDEGGTVSAPRRNRRCLPGSRAGDRPRGSRRRRGVGTPHLRQVAKYSHRGRTVFLAEFQRLLQGRMQGIRIPGRPSQGLTII